MASTSAPTSTSAAEGGPKGWLSFAGTPLRSLQSDALELDDYVLRLVSAEWSGATRLLLPGNFTVRQSPVIAFAFEFALLLLTVGRGLPSPGMQVLSLRYETAARAGSPSLSRRLLYCLLKPGTRLLWEVASEASEGTGRASLACRTLCGAWHLASALRVLNMLAFYRHGRYASLLERVMGLRKVYADPAISRGLTYGLVDQDVVWREASAFATFALVGLGAWVRRTGWTRGRILRNVGLHRLRGGTRSDRRCAICDKEPTQVSYAHPCGHAHCYLCLSTALKSGKYTCHACRVPCNGLAR